MARDIFNGLVNANNGVAELENPPAWLNLQYGTFDTTTGVKTSDTSSWSIGLQDEQPYNVLTSVIGNGFSFDCIKGFVLNLYHSSERGIKIFVDGVFLREVLYSGEGWQDIDAVTFDDNTVHSVTIIHSYGAFLSANYIDIYTSNVTISNQTGKVKPLITVKSNKTNAYFSALGKTVGTTAHPFTSRSYNSTNPLAINPTNETTESIQDVYNFTRFYDGEVTPYATTTNGAYRSYILEYSFLASGSPYSGLTATDLQSYLTSVVNNLWAYGEGYNSGTGLSDYGLEVYIWNHVTQAWVLYADNVADYPESIEVTLTDLGDFVDSNGKHYLTVKSKYPSDGTIGSAVYLDFASLLTTLDLAKVSTEVLTNVAYNLIPPFTSADWSIATNATVVSDYKLSLTSTDTATTGDVSFVNVTVTPNKTYYINKDALQATGGRLLVYGNSNLSGDLITVTNNAFVAPTTGQISVRLDAAFNIGTFIFEKPILAQSSSSVGFRSQVEYSVGCTVEQVLTTGDTLQVDGTGLSADKNGTSITLQSGSYFELLPGDNTIQAQHTGGNIRLTIIDEEKTKIAAFDSIYIPYISSLEKSKTFIGDRQRTAYGKMRQDITAVKRVWDIQTAPMTREEASTLLDHLESINYRSGDFWLDEFGSAVDNAVVCYIPPENIKESRIEFGRDSIWYNDGVQLTLQVVER